MTLRAPAQTRQRRVGRSPRGELVDLHGRLQTISTTDASDDQTQPTILRGLGQGVLHGLRNRSRATDDVHLLRLQVLQGGRPQATGPQDP